MQSLARACKTGCAVVREYKRSPIRRMLRNDTLGLDCLLLKLREKIPSLSPFHSRCEGHLGEILVWNVSWKVLLRDSI